MSADKRLRLSAFLALSLDGCAAGPDDDLSWLPQSDGGEDYGFKAFLSSVDALLMGRRTYEVICAFPELPYGDIPLYVLTAGRDPKTVNNPHNAHIHQNDLQSMIHLLHEEGINHLYVDGPTLIRGCMNLHMLNSLTITVIPKILGDGIPLFKSGGPPADLRLAGVREFSDSIVQLEYRLI